MEYTNSQIKELIDEYIHSELDRGLLVDRLIHGRTFERIAFDHQLDPKTVRKRVYKCKEILFRHLP